MVLTGGSCSITNIHITLDTYADVFDRMHTDSVEKFDTLMEQLERSIERQIDLLKLW